jgi:hypothetical protein
VSCAIYCIWKQRDQKTRSMLSVKIAALQGEENYLYKCRIEFREILGEIGVIVVRDGRGVLCVSHVDSGVPIVEEATGRDAGYLRRSGDEGFGKDALDRRGEANAIQFIDTTMGVALEDHLERVLAEGFINFGDLLSF